jgi:hypothetical protein
VLLLEIVLSQAARGAGNSDWACSLQDAPASQMFLREHAGRQYLFIGDNSTQHFTRRCHRAGCPNVIETVASPQDPSNGKLETVGTGLTLAFSRMTTAS